MIAPARVAAYEILVGGLGGPRRPLRRARRHARASLRRRSRPGAGRRDRHRRPALARGARPPHRAFRQAAARPARSRSRRDPAPQRLSTAAPHARAGRRGRGRCGGSDGAGGQAERQRPRERRAARRLAHAQRAAAAAAARTIRPIAKRALDYLSITLSHPRWLAARWLDRLGFDAAEAWMRFNNAPAPLTLRANRLRTRRDELTERLRQRRRRRPRRPLRARRADRRPRDSRLRGAGPGRRLVRRAGRGLAARDAARRRRARAARARHLRVARRQDDGARGGACGGAACSSPATSATGACDCCGARSPPAAPTTSGSCRPTCCSRCRFGRVFDCVLVDAPCSGLGTLRRDPDIRWRRQEADLAGAGGRPARDAPPRGRRRSRPAAGWSTRPARASRKKTKRSSDAFLRGAAGFAPVDRARGASALPPAVDRRARTSAHLVRTVHGLEAFFGAVFEQHGRTTQSTRFGRSANL